MLLSSALLFAQEKEKETFRFEFEQDSLEINVGQEKQITIRLLNEDGDLAQNPFYVFGQRKALSASPRISDSTGLAVVTVKAFKPGRAYLRTRTITVNRNDRISDRLLINVPYPPLDRIVFDKMPKKLYAGTVTSFDVEVFDKANLSRPDADVVLKSSKNSVGSFDKFMNLEAKKPGKITVTASADGVKKSFKINIVKNPTQKITINSNVTEIRTGDVLNMNAKALDKRGKVLNDVPISYSYTGQADYGTFGLPTSGLITDDGRFVAETAGMYTLYASSAGFSSQKRVKVVPRNVEKKIKLIGHGLITDVFTSDLWVWPGIGKHEGKDFAVTGTWGANGEAYFWDVTDPTDMKIIDTVTVDARTVNDVKISEDGKVGVITREGASNRKNGFVILDVSDPYDVKITAAYNDDMTGGVHNAFIYENHVYAVNNGRKYDIINIDDPSNPFRVGTYELNTPGHGVHDVWVIDGLAYSSNWADGVHVVDVGGVKFNEKNRSKIKYNPFLAMAGQGSPGNPVKLGGVIDPNGHNHAAFPFISQSTNKFYIIAGDEWSNQFGMAGGFHFWDFTDPKKPVETAVFQVPEAGSHNHWVHGDTLLASNYQGGLRIVDISGELMGDIYSQGREIAFFKPIDNKGFKPNQTNVWGTMPYKGLIYFSDMYNGLWAVKLESETQMARN